MTQVDRFVSRVGHDSNDDWQESEENFWIGQSAEVQPDLVNGGANFNETQFSVQNSSNQLLARIDYR
jgi:hypothetical protein